MSGRRGAKRAPEASDISMAGPARDSCSPGLTRPTLTRLALTRAWLASQHPAMANEPPNKAPRLSETGRRSQAEHRARQAAALRDNLSRRKQQQRARQADSAAGAVSPPDTDETNPD